MLVRAPAKQSAQGVRAVNAGLVLNEIWTASGRISRADIARSTGLSRSTISAIVGELLEAGLVEETHVARTRAGRPPIVLAFRDDAFTSIGIEMGSSHVTVVACDARGNVRSRRRREWDVAGDAAGTLALMGTFVSACLEDAKNTTIIGIGIAVPCPLDTSEVGTLSRRILPAWEGINLVERMTAEHDLPILVENDANMGALAEHWWGACTGEGFATYIKVATGVGAGHIIDGQLFRGATGIAGEIGHTVVADAGGHLCRCGLHGCLEAEVGSAAIVAQANERLDKGSQSTLQGGPGLTLAHVLAEAGNGDQVSVEVIAQAGAHLGIAVANLLNLMNPARVVIGGRLAAAGDLLLAPLRATIRERALWSSIARADVVLSDLGEEHVALGAATLVLGSALAAPQNLNQRSTRWGASWAK